ncbi:hypothetical protein Taro_013200 [Colocasia esculenta]|uniref:Uncharacterized protein n=1 Tax=Colocasia esculenta TaxID=4460 RepID=A0A843UAX1_COLES|nr:hypothetical protein [Colocasia esculenta]
MVIPRRSGQRIEAEQQIGAFPLGPLEALGRVASMSALPGLTPSPPPPPTTLHADDEASHHEGEGSYGETMRAVWINEGEIIDLQSIQMSYVLDLYEQPLQKQISNIFCIMFEEMQAKFLQAQIESYSRGMDERYGDDSQCPELEPNIWIAASEAPKKGHVYGFRHSLCTARVISSCLSSVSHATSSFTTPAASGGPSSAATTMTLAQFREIVNETVSHNISHIVSQTISETLTQLGFLGDIAPPAQQPQHDREGESDL